MYHGMNRCIECGRWFFNWRKYHRHLVLAHDYTVELPEENNDGEEIE